MQDVTEKAFKIYWTILRHVPSATIYSYLFAVLHLHQVLIWSSTVEPLLHHLHVVLASHILSTTHFIGRTAVTAHRLHPLKSDWLYPFSHGWIDITPTTCPWHVPAQRQFALILFPPWSRLKSTPLMIDKWINTLGLIWPHFVNIFKIHPVQFTRDVGKGSLYSTVVSLGLNELRTSLPYLKQG